MWSPASPWAFLLAVGFEYVLFPALILTAILSRALRRLFWQHDTSAGAVTWTFRTNPVRWAVLSVVLGYGIAAGGQLYFELSDSNYPMSPLAQILWGGTTLVVVLMLLWWLLYWVGTMGLLDPLVVVRRILSATVQVVMVGAVILAVETYFPLPAAKVCLLVYVSKDLGYFNYIYETSDTIYGVALQYDKASQPVGGSGHLLIVPRTGVTATFVGDRDDSLPLCPTLPPKTAPTTGG